MSSFTDEQIKRYSRHIILPEVGGKGQKKINNAKVFCVGAGGLGSPVALYLAAAGVGTIGIIDADVVDLSNLQRQILHATPDLGKPKVESARETLTALNPDLNVVVYKEYLSVDNIMGIIKDYDIVLDGSDNFPTRFLVNDAAYFAKKILISGSIFRFDGQVTTFKHNLETSPCYRCLYPEPPPAGLVPSCQEAGVLGVIAGTVGVLQATEALKEILGAGDSLMGRLIIYDAFDLRFQEVRIHKDPNCPLCGRKPKIKELMAYEQTCHL
ncbi:MAG: molybdopterin-synthase adenylyltransferase MoeB [Nitrospirae bacterium]|nr:molybdopterin-synthase adenylyltransferase MoeB [Nitrospirota bacterium]